MSNTKSPETRSYRICRTVNKEHLNGVISLIDFEDNTGIATVYVSELRDEKPDPVWHVSSEIIIFDGKQWKTKEPHIRYNGDKQNWYFAKISKRSEGPPKVIGEKGGDNGKDYETYIKYEFVSVDTPPWTSNINNLKQGDGTGTGGNGEK